MAEMKLDPEPQALVERARAEACEQGKLHDTPGAASDDPLSAEERAALIDWVESGDYDRAIAEFVADDPGLTSQ